MSEQHPQNTLRVVKQKTNNFTIIDNEILRNKNLSLKARGLLCFMLHLPDDWVFSERGLVTVTGEGIRSIKSGLKELEDNKYLYRFQGKATGGKFSNSFYYLFEEPTDMVIDFPSSKKKEETSSSTETPTFTPPTIGTFILDKNHPDYDYLNGGWMLE